MKWDTKKQLYVAGAILLVVIIGFIFYWISRSADQLESEGGLPDNSQYQIINNDGNLEIIGSNDELGDDANIKQITATAIAGYRLIETGTEHRLRYIESSTGYVYDYYPIDNYYSRLTNTSWPRITNARWVGDDWVLISYDDDGLNINYLAKVDGQNARLTGHVMPSTLQSIIEGPDNQVYYTARSITGGTNLYRHDLDSAQSTLVRNFNSLWLDLHTNPDDASGDTLIASTRINSANNKQVIYQISNDGSAKIINSGHQTKYGLVAGNGTVLLIGDKSITSRLNNDDQVSSQLITLADKCAISNLAGDDYICAVINPNEINHRIWPANWYRGQYHPTEALISLDPEIMEPLILFDLGNNYDVFSLAVVDDYVYFISRLNSQLYQVYRGTSLPS